MTFTPSPETIAYVHAHSPYDAVVRHSIIKGQPWGEFAVQVIAIEGDTLYYTTDGLWYSTATRSAITDWAYTPDMVTDPETGAVVPAAEAPAPAFVDSEPLDYTDESDLEVADMGAYVAAPEGATADELIAHVEAQLGYTPISARSAAGAFPDAATLADYSASPTYSDRPLQEHASMYPAAYTARYARTGA